MCNFAKCLLGKDVPTVDSGAYAPQAQHGIFAKSAKLVSGGQMSRMYECCIGIKIISDVTGQQ